MDNNYIHKFFKILQLKQTLFFLFLFCISGCITVTATNQEITETPRLMVLIPDEYDEVSLTTLIQNADTFRIPYQIVSLSKKTDSGLTLQRSPLITLKDIPASYTNQSEIALVVIGGKDFQNLVDNQNVTTLLSEWAQKNHLIGGIGEGPAVLAQAGILKNISATVSPQPNLIRTLKEGGARYDDSPGVLTDTIITARNSEDADEFAEAILSRLIIDHLTSSIGIIYLGDTSGSAYYIIPSVIKDTTVSAADNISILSNWNGEPFNFYQDLEMSIKTGFEDWVLICYPTEGICQISNPFSAITIPYGSIQEIKTDKLGEMRDFSTVEGKIGTLFPNTSFQDIIRSVPELDQSNQSLKDWTHDVTVTNKTISDSLGDLFDDIRIEMPVWNGLSSTVCIKGRIIRNGIIDIRIVKEDEATSILYSKGTIKDENCAKLLLNENFPAGSSAFLVLTGKDKNIISEILITLPNAL